VSHRDLLSDYIIDQLCWKGPVRGGDCWPTIGEAFTSLHGEPNGHLNEVASHRPVSEFVDIHGALIRCPFVVGGTVTVAEGVPLDGKQSGQSVAAAVAAAKKAEQVDPRP
jgi:hypothetical protein